MGGRGTDRAGALHHRPRRAPRSGKDRGGRLRRLQRPRRMPQREAASSQGRVQGPVPLSGGHRPSVARWGAVRRGALCVVRLGH